ncbi:MAG TPA: addiction module protein [Enteractinococcus helveticum]|uniref:Addiction module protein n=1 Tax=Enteractinococcus helveticum TaxID=1837282 RepID=A0A921FQF2_9MICC|nr:addiction module protein [Enteractinococcus helveticum]HJF15839.1 addiction module protein [Enteractinococcus helveticum]
MVDRRLLQEAQGLDDVDKLELAQELLSSVQFDALPVTPEEAALVEKRLAAQSANPDDKISSAEVWDRIKRQYQ